MRLPKEILDAADLQPQHRTFVEIRDYMLQQARQLADGFVRDVCPTTKKIVTTPSRVSTSMNSPTAKKNTTVPMDVSQMSSTESKSETEGQEIDSYRTTRIRIVTETSCSRSRAKVRVASRELVSNVE